MNIFPANMIYLYCLGRIEISTFPQNTIHESIFWYNTRSQSHGSQSNGFWVSEGHQIFLYIGFITDSYGNVNIHVTTLWHTLFSFQYDIAVGHNIT